VTSNNPQKTSGKPGEVGYRRLTAWQKADELAFRVYSATRGFPRDEAYGLTSQLRRAVLSVPTNGMLRAVCAQALDIIV
jgi:hypothetical protein